MYLFAIGLFFFPLETLFSFPIFPYFFLNFLPEKLGQVSNLTTILSFSFLVNMCTHSQLLGCVQLFVTPWSLPSSSVHGISQARILERGCHFLLQGIFPTLGSNPRLLH